MECDDMVRTQCWYSTKTPSFPGSQVHIIMWERQGPSPVPDHSNIECGRHVFHPDVVLSQERGEHQVTGQARNDTKSRILKQKLCIPGARKLNEGPAMMKQRATNGDTAMQQTLTPSDSELHIQTVMRRTEKDVCTARHTASEQLATNSDEALASMNAAAQDVIKTNTVVKDKLSNGHTSMALHDLQTSGMLAQKANQTITKSFSIVLPSGETKSLVLPVNSLSGTIYKPKCSTANIHKKINLPVLPCDETKNNVEFAAGRLCNAAVSQSQDQLTRPGQTFSVVLPSGETKTFVLPPSLLTNGSMMVQKSNAVVPPSDTSLSSVLPSLTTMIAPPSVPQRSTVISNPLSVCTKSCLVGAKERNAARLARMRENLIKKKKEVPKTDLFSHGSTQASTPLERLKAMRYAPTKQNIAAFKFPAKSPATSPLPSPVLNQKTGKMSYLAALKPYLNMTPPPSPSLSVERGTGYTFEGYMRKSDILSYTSRPRIPLVRPVKLTTKKNISKKTLSPKKSVKFAPSPTEELLKGVRRKIGESVSEVGLKRSRNSTQEGCSNGVSADVSESHINIAEFKPKIASGVTEMRVAAPLQVPPCVMTASSNDHSSELLTSVSEQETAAEESIFSMPLDFF